VQPEKRGLFSFLRHPLRKAQPKPVEPDLRRRICKDGSCVECPPGQSAGKNGKCGTSPQSNIASNQCQSNESWNGAACMAVQSCSANESWNGARCVARTDECGNISARAALQAHEVRAARMGMAAACANNPSGQQCGDLKRSYDSAVQRYRMLMNEASPNCRSMLQDPLSL
jgi:hypothetical protein